MGRPPIGKTAMTAAERMRRLRARRKAERHRVTKPVTKHGRADTAPRRQAVGEKAMTDTERKRRSRARKKMSEADDRALFDIHSSPEAKKLAREVQQFMQRLGLELAPWFEGEPTPADRELLRYALGGGTDILGRWTLGLLRKNYPSPHAEGVTEIRHIRYTATFYELLTAYAAVVDRSYARCNGSKCSPA